MIAEIAQVVVDYVASWGYIGIFFLMLLESSFIPFPSEIVLIPAGYLASQGEMSLWLIMLFAMVGSMAGAIINYYLAKSLGRRFLIKFGHYVFIKPSTLDKMDNYFLKHGHISTFIGRLLPGVRQLISIPAGIAKMGMKLFLTYTALGAVIWSSILVALGYFIGENKELLAQYLHQITVGVVVSVIVLVLWYYKKNR